MNNEVWQIWIQHIAIIFDIYLEPDFFIGVIIGPS